MNKQELLKSIKSCISVDFEHAQYRRGQGLGIGSSVFAALDDALFMLAENGNDDELANNEYVVAAFEQLMSEYQGSGDVCVIPRLRCKIEGSTAYYSVEFERIEAARLREAEVEQEWAEGITIIDGNVLDLDDERYDVIPADDRRKIRQAIEESEHYFYIDVDLREVKLLLLDFAEEQASSAAR